MAIAPTGSTSMIAGTTAGIDPVMSRYFLEEKKSGILPRVAPELTMDTFWYYKNAHLSIRLGLSVPVELRQRYIDQAQKYESFILQMSIHSEKYCIYICLRGKRESKRSTISVLRVWKWKSVKCALRRRVCLGEKRKGENESNGRVKEKTAV